MTRYAFRFLFPLGAFLFALSWPALAAQAFSYTGPQSFSCHDPDSLSCVGQWSGPYDLGISTCPQPPPPEAHCEENQYDDIGHATLIPVGPHEGEILVWSERSYAAGYTSHIWDPRGLVVSASPPFSPGLDRPFCSGHAWVLDDETPKFLAVGGVEPMSSCNDCGDPTDLCGSRHTYWFDPTTASPANMWRRDTPDLPEPAWYPSVIVYNGTDPLFPVLPIAIGGSRIQGTCCQSLWESWYTLGSPTAPSWTTRLGTDLCNGVPYSWDTYFRTMLTTRDVIVATGSFVDCNNAPTFKPCHGYGAPWGGNPVRLINVPPHPAPHQDRQGPDPNDPSSPIQEVGGWRFANAAILHTLKQGVVFPQDPGDVATNLDAYYERDRVLVFGGVPLKPTVTDRDALATTAELLDTDPTDPANWSWHRKADAPTGRNFGNWTILPDGTLLAVGGGSRQGIYDPDFEYHASTERFWRGEPTQPGSWKVLAERPPVPGFDVATPRNYHSVGVLDATGAVWLMGGRRHVEPGLGGITLLPDPEDTAEVYRPPYFFQGTRPALTAVSDTIRYGTPFCVETRDPETISHAVLIGLASVTHHFDYGQRYVELLVDTDPGGECPGSTNVRILPPPIASMAPPGYYLLFLVDGAGRPSVGKFVLLNN